jgi:radical SAM-linked protein
VNDRQRLHVIFRKGDGARYLSHLDLMATLEFSIRRADLPVALSEGFNPRPKMSLILPLVLGHIGEREILEVTLRRRVEPGDLGHRLQAVLPSGITVLEVCEVPAEGKSAASRVRSATYRIDLPAPVSDLADRVGTLMDREAVEVQEERAGATHRRDVRSLILSLVAADAQTLRLQVTATGDGTVRPEHVLDLLALPRDGAAISREAIELA